MRITAGALNPSKIERFNDMTGYYDAELITPASLQIHDEPRETGDTPAPDRSAWLTGDGAYA